MKKIFLSFFAFVFAATSCVEKTEQFDADSNLEYCHQQVEKTLSLLGNENREFPHAIMNGEKEWVMRDGAQKNWTMGFWPGILWYDYENTKDAGILESAEYYTQLLDTIFTQEINNHDIGFQVFCSYGNGYRLTGKQEYKDKILKAAEMLSTLYNPVVGTIKSWTWDKRYPHNTIIDNLMNLELLFWAAKNGGDKKFYDIAVHHATTSMINHFRPDGSSYHMIGYDTVTGKKIEGITVQGYANESMWARGQSWGVYGYTMIYRETGDKKFLQHAVKVADMFVDNLPADYIPYWDFRLPDFTDEPRDASAACVVASALLDLCGYVEKKELKEKYYNAAINILSSLSSPAYRSGDLNPSFVLHSTGFRKRNLEVDSSLIYADYYYIEALLKLKKMKDGRK